MKKPLNDLKNELIGKYGYESDFAETIAIMTDSIVNYYGEEYENLITDAIMSCKYIIAGTEENKYENIYDVLKRENMLDDTIGEDIVTDGDLKRAGGVYQSLPRISYKDGVFSIDRVDRLLVLPYYFNKEHPDSLGILAHETLHLIKAYLRAYSIEGNILHERFGFHNIEYDLSYNDGRIEKRIIKNVGTGFEEGVNTHDEYAVMHESYDDTYESAGYGFQRVTAEYLIFDLDLKSMIDKSALTGDLTELIELFDQIKENAFIDFNNAMDESVRLAYERFKNIFDEKKLKESTEKSRKQFEEGVIPFIRSLEKVLSKEISEENVAIKSA